ncbi:hypothetical protein Lser_V15G15850 [Lactuca serriola]
MRLDSSFSGHSQSCLQSKEVIKIIHCISYITVENDNLESFSDDSSTDDVDDSSMELEVNNPGCACIITAKSIKRFTQGCYCESLFCTSHVLCATDIAYCNSIESQIRVFVVLGDHACLHGNDMQLLVVQRCQKLIQKQLKPEVKQIWRKLIYVISLSEFGCYCESLFCIHKHCILNDLKLLDDMDSRD